MAKQNIFRIDYKENILFLKKTNKKYSRLLSYPIICLFSKIIKADKYTFKDLSLENNEARKLKDLFKKGLNVPNIITQYDDFFIMENKGISVESHLIKTKANNLDNLLNKVIENIIDWHQNNHLHGATQLRNFLYNFKEDQVYRIDFEEDLDSILKAEALKAYELLLFLSSLMYVITNKAKRLETMKSLLNKYKQAYKGSEEYLNIFAKWLSRFAGLIKLYPFKLGDDAIRILELDICLNT